MITRLIADSTWVWLFRASGAARWLAILSSMNRSTGKQNLVEDAQMQIEASSLFSLPDGLELTSMEELLAMRQASAMAETIYQLVQEFFRLVHTRQGTMFGRAGFALVRQRVLHAL